MISLYMSIAGSTFGAGDDYTHFFQHQNARIPTPFGCGTVSGGTFLSTSGASLLFYEVPSSIASIGAGTMSLIAMDFGAAFNGASFLYILCVTYLDLVLPNLGTCGAFFRLHANGYAVYHVCAFIGWLYH